MASEIETALYGDLASHVTPDGDVGNHCVMEFCVFRNLRDSDSVRLRIAARRQEYRTRQVATFKNALLVRLLQTENDPEELVLPWDIVGFYSEQRESGRWGFNLNCHSVRFGWESDWPEIEWEHL